MAIGRPGLTRRHRSDEPSTLAAEPITPGADCMHGVEVEDYSHQGIIGGSIRFFIILHPGRTWDPGAAVEYVRPAENRVVFTTVCQRLPVGERAPLRRV